LVYNSTVVIFLRVFNDFHRKFALFPLLSESYSETPYFRTPITFSGFWRVLFDKKYHSDWFECALASSIYLGNARLPLCRSRFSLDDFFFLHHPTFLFITDLSFNCHSCKFFWWLPTLQGYPNPKIATIRPLLFSGEILKISFLFEVAFGTLSHHATFWFITDLSFNCHCCKFFWWLPTLQGCPNPKIWTIRLLVFSGEILKISF